MRASQVRLEEESDLWAAARRGLGPHYKESGAPKKKRPRGAAAAERVSASATDEAPGTAGPVANGVGPGGPLPPGLLRWTEQALERTASRVWDALRGRGGEAPAIPALGTHEHHASKFKLPG